MRHCLITFVCLLPSLALGQGIEINAKIGGFTVTADGRSMSREASEYSIKSPKPKHFNKAVELLKEARQEQNTEVTFCVDRMVQAVVVRQPSCPTPPTVVCHCQPLPVPTTCCDPGPIPHCIRVKCWINRTDFVDCNGRRWHWCTRNCVWVNP